MEDELKTKLTPEEEARFRKWYEATAATLGLDADPDSKEHYYDYRGYWKENGDNANLKTGDHFPDTYKLPGHETFSNESKYYSAAPEMAGRWENGKWIPPQTQAPAVEGDAQTKATTEPTIDDRLKQAQIELDNKDAEYARQLAESNKQTNKTFADMVNDYYEEKKAEEERMRAEEQSDRMATMATGVTELAANIINMFSVGELHATNQKYHSYSQDWMKRADENIRENRRRRKDMADTLRRLKIQQEQVRQSGSLEEMKLNAQLARERYNRLMTEKKEAETRADKQWEKDFRERQQTFNEEKTTKDQELREKSTNASIAQGWANVNLRKDAQTNEMLSKGWVPDKSAPGGFRYDPQKAAELGGIDVATISANSRGGGSGRSGTTAYPILDANGDVNVAYLKSDEMKSILINAREAIRKDLGEDEARDFDREMRRAADDNARNAVLMNWIGKSEKMGEMIRSVDPQYAGNHRRRNLVDQQEEKADNQSGYYHPENDKTGLGNFK